MSDCWCLEVPGPTLLMRSLWMGKDGGASSQGIVEVGGGGLSFVLFCLGKEYLNRFVGVRHRCLPQIFPPTPCLAPLIHNSRMLWSSLLLTQWRSSQVLSILPHLHPSPSLSPLPLHAERKGKSSRSVMSNSLRPYGLQATRLLRPWDFPGKSTGVGYHCLLR